MCYWGCRNGIMDNCLEEAHLGAQVGSGGKEGSCTSKDWPLAPLLATPPPRSLWHSHPGRVCILSFPLPTGIRSNNQDAVIIVLLQAAAENYKLEPGEQFGAGSRIWSGSERVRSKVAADGLGGSGGTTCLPVHRNCVPGSLVIPRFFCRVTAGTPVAGQTLGGTPEVWLLGDHRCHSILQLHPVLPAGAQS